MKPINKRHSILSLTIAALLTTGIASHSEIGYASNDDGDERGNDNEAKKITICHVPKGNPENAHTIHIGVSAWKAHRDNHGGDYLGSCTQAPAPSTTVDEVHIITGCQGDYKATLIKKVQSYYEPVVINDDALDDTPDENILTAVSQCLDAGDSSDSGKGKDDNNKDSNEHGNNRGAGKGLGHDSVSDSGHHHFISGCKNKVAKEENDSDSSDSQHQHYSDSEKNGSKASYHKNLKLGDSAYDKAKGLGHGDSAGIIVSDSSLDDSGKEGHDSGDVWAKYKACFADADGKIDSAKVKANVDSGKGDSGHKYRVVKGCPALKTAVEKHKERVKDPNDTKYKDRPIVITKASLQDVAIKDAVAACLDPKQGKGTVTIKNNLDKTGKNGRLNWREITNP